MNSTHERPILFSGPMVRAILAGKKTITRRIVMPQPAADSNLRDVRSAPAHILAPSFRCPFGVPGDRLWVRETFYCDHAFAGDYSDPGHVGEPSSREQQEAEWRDAVYYRADGEPDFEAPDGPTPWKPSIHMPRWASRIDLEVTAVRVERLQDITEEDALAEGLRPLREQGLRTIGQPGWQWGDGQGEGARDAFSVLWDDINGKKAPWAANPWVWVVSFKRVRPA